MADSRLDLIIKARDEASAILKKIQGELGGIDKQSTTASRGLDGMRDSLASIGAISSVAFVGIAAGLKTTIDAYSQAQSSQLGFEATAKKLKVPIDNLNIAAQKLSADGLIPLSTAQAGMQNLMQAGLTDVDKITKLMQNFKDEAVFGKSASIDLATAVSNLSESYKTESSSLGNLSGISENYSMVLERGAKQLGKRVVDLTEAERAEAKYLGLLEIGAVSAGNSALAAESLSGAQAKANTAFREAQIAIGEALAPALTSLLSAVTPIIQKVTEWVEKNPELVAQMAGLALGVTGVGVAMGALSVLMTPAVLAFGKFLLIATAVAGAAALIKEAYDTNFAGFKTTVDGAASSFSGFVDTIKQKSNEAYIAVEFWWSQWGDVITPILEDFKTIITETFSTVSGVIKHYFDTIINPALKGFGDAMSTAFGQAWEVLGEAAKTFEAWWNGGIKPLLTTIKNAWNSDWGGIRTFTMGVLNAITTVISAFGESIVGVMKTTMILFATPIKATLQVLRGDFDGAWKTIKSGFSSAWNTITSMVVSVMNKLGSVFSSGWDFIVSTFQKAGPIMLESVTMLLSSINNLFGGWPEKMFQFGVWAIQGLIDGIGSMASAAVSKVSEVGNNMINALNVFQWGSPSKLTTQYGEWIMEGLTIGIDSASGGTVEAINTATSKLTESMQKAVDEYASTSEEIGATLQKLGEDHGGTMEKLSGDIQKVVGEIKTLKKEYDAFGTGQAMSFGSELVKQEQKVAELQAELQKTQITGGGEEKISDIQTRLAAESAILEQARGTYLTSEQDLRSKILSAEQAMTEQMNLLRTSTDVQETARVQARINEMQTKLEYMKIQESNFSEEQKKFALGVETARRRSGMSEMERFLLDMQEKRVAEKTAYEEKLKQKEKELADLKEQTKQEMEIFFRKQQAIKTIQDIMQSNHKRLMEEQTKVTADEINKQIDFYNRLAEAAKNAFAAKSSVGVARFAEGGMVGGIASQSIGTDKIPAMLSAGEVVLNAAQQRNLAGALESDGGGRNVTINIEQMIGDEQYAEKLGDMIVKNLAYSTAF